MLQNKNIPTNINKVEIHSLSFSESRNSKIQYIFNSLKGLIESYFAR